MRLERGASSKIAATGAELALAADLWTALLASEKKKGGHTKSACFVNMVFPVGSATNVSSTSLQVPCSWMEHFVIRVQQRNPFQHQAFVLAFGHWPRGGKGSRGWEQAVQTTPTKQVPRSSKARPDASVRPRQEMEDLYQFGSHVLLREQARALEQLRFCLGPGGYQRSTFMVSLFVILSGDLASDRRWLIRASTRTSSAA